MKPYKTVTDGLSPKVRNPALVTLAAGVVLIILSVIASDSELRTIGIGMLGASGIGAGVGAASPVGEVLQLPSQKEPAPIAADNQFTGETRAQLNLDDEV
jgi:hypothetical protein